MFLSNGPPSRREDHAPRHLHPAQAAVEFRTDVKKLTMIRRVSTAEAQPKWTTKSLARLPTTFEPKERHRTATVAARLWTGQTPGCSGPPA